MVGLTRPTRITRRLCTLAASTFLAYRPGNWSRSVQSRSAYRSRAAGTLPCVTVRNPPNAVREVDFLWERHKTIVEADGMTKYSTKEDILAQFRRDRLLRDAGYKVVHFT